MCCHKAVFISIRTQHNYYSKYIYNKYRYLDRLELAQEAIASLQDNCETSICICYKGYRGWMSRWHIDKATMHKMVALGVEVDFDLYAYGEQDLP